MAVIRHDDLGRRPCAMTLAATGGDAIDRGRYLCAGWRASAL